MKTCVVSQPTFLPWLGWFDLADQGDVMVILDDVAFSKQSWQQRNRIRSPRGLEYLTVPVKTSGRLGQPISECEVAGDKLSKDRVYINLIRGDEFWGIGGETYSNEELGVYAAKFGDGQPLD